MLKSLLKSFSMFKEDYSCIGVSCCDLLFVVLKKLYFTLFEHHCKKVSSALQLNF